MKNVSVFVLTIHFGMCLTPEPATDLPMTHEYRSSDTAAQSTRKSRAESGRAEGTDTPLLGRIFGRHTAPGRPHHHHHDHKWGPHFEASTSNITVQAGGSASLDCRVSLLQDKTVSWVRRKVGNSGKEGSSLELLTVGTHAHSADPRYTVQLQYPNNWRLQITPADKADEGTYECHVSTHPPRVLQLHLHVNAPEIVIVDGEGNELHDKYYEEDSTIQLDCMIRHLDMTSPVVNWLHDNKTLNYDTTRGGISVKSSLHETGASSSLSIARVNQRDSGKYTCSISHSQFVSVLVHVLNGESLAELQQGGQGSAAIRLWTTLVPVLLLLAPN